MKARSPIDRIMARVVLTPGPLASPCWITGMKPTQYGYVKIAVPGRKTPAFVHRVTYEHFIGPIPDGLVIDHLCRVKACCNPAHLEPVTSRENSLRGMGRNIIAWRTNTCRRGHSLLDAYVGKKGRRCRVCRNAQDRLSRSVRAEVTPDLLREQDAIRRERWHESVRAEVTGLQEGSE